jgi:hypothetical protein
MVESHRAATCVLEEPVAVGLEEGCRRHSMCSRGGPPPPQHLERESSARRDPWQSLGLYFSLGDRI